MELPSRIVGRFDNGKPGVLFICLAAVHGNEPAGVKALKEVFALLKQQQETSPDFQFHGRFLGLIGNMQALNQDKRFIEEDLNRILTADRIEKALSLPSASMDNEDLEIREFVSVIHGEIESYNPEQIIVLDIHSTSAEGGVFTIVAKDEQSIQIGKNFHVPVILDFAREVEGTTLGYFTKARFKRDITAIVFECGQHTEPTSPQRAIAAIINCMRTIGCLDPGMLKNNHESLLTEYAKGLPRVARLIEHCVIDESKPFVLSHAYKNFESVSAGQVIGHNGSDPIKSKHEGLILLPRLQDQGSDGFFVVSPE